MAGSLAPGFAGGLAQGIGSGVQLADIFRGRRQQQQALDLRERAQEAQEESALKRLKLQQDTLKLQQTERAKQADLQQEFFKVLGERVDGAEKEGQMRQILERQGGPTSQAGQQLEALPTAGGMTSPAAFVRLQQLAAAGGLENQLGQAIEQGFVQTPQSLTAGQVQSNEARLASEKTRAQIDKLNRDATRERRPPVPNQVALALEAAGGNAAEALKLLNPRKGGLDIEFNEDGTVASVSTGASSNKLLRDQITGIQGLNNSAQPIRVLRTLLQQDISSPTIQGQLRALGTSLQSNIAAFNPTGPKGKEIKQRIAQSRDVSEFEFLSEMAAFSVAAINNPGGRISDADVASARNSLGLGSGAFTRPRAAELIIPRLDAALSLLEGKVESHQQTIQLLQGGQIQTDTPRRRQPERRTTSAAGASNITNMATEDLEAELRRLQGG